MLPTFIRQGTAVADGYHPVEVFWCSQGAPSKSTEGRALLPRERRYSRGVLFTSLRQSNGAPLAIEAAAYDVLSRRTELAVGIPGWCARGHFVRV